MGLAVYDTEILTIPEFTDLMNSLDPSHEIPAKVTAWFCGETVTADDLLPALDVGVRIGVTEDGGHTIIDKALGRLHEVRGEGA
jgi:hypothetical protein